MQRSERPQGGESADDAGVAAAVREATAQLERYLADERLARQFLGVRFVGLIVVFHGWELVFLGPTDRLGAELDRREPYSPLASSVQPARASF